jgi:hypothetical protein
MKKQRKQEKQEKQEKDNSTQANTMIDEAKEMKSCE